MNSRLAALIILQLSIIGCNNRRSERIASVPSTESRPSNQSDEMPFDDDPFANIDWDSIPTDRLDPMDLFKTADYQIGDIVPCSDELAEFVLKINAMSGDKCFYRLEQAFCTYERASPDPSDQRGMSQENLVCAMLVNGFASGTFQFVDLAADSVTVRIDWKASQNDEEQEFTGEFTPGVDRSGTANAGKGNTFAWSLLRSDKRDRTTENLTSRRH